MLLEKEKDLLEVHLLECDYCFRQFVEFAPRRAMLLWSEEILQLLDELHPQTDSPGSTWQRLRRVLWPEGVPLVLKPLVLAAALMLMIYPAYLGLRKGQAGEVATVQEIALMQTRSPETFSADKGQSAVISFLCPDGAPGTVYSVSLRDKDGTIIYKDDRFSSTDSYDVGRILLPSNLASPGSYTLTVRIVGAPVDERVTFEYVFRIAHSE
ncbi:MAG: hypothetical protein AB1483_09115 [Candidatus Zixiibacteriota bacterium]